MTRFQNWEQELQRLEAEVRTVRILILGDPGVGKSCLTNLLANSAITPTRSSRTVSNSEWTVQARLHEYPIMGHLPLTPEWTSLSSSERSNQWMNILGNPREPPPASNVIYFVEFYDKNSSMSKSRVDRHPLYKNMDGIVLVYNMKDMESQDHLHDWIYGPLLEISQHRHKKRKRILDRHHVPILVVGTMLDTLRTRPLRRFGTIAHQLGAEEIFLNCLDPDLMAEKTHNYGKVCKFLNRAVDFKMCNSK
ncbi:rab-like protein 3 [Drosophila miranda]|uniref:rab-like protein 3 n=1 Tax=Drosophila miranda TaxID=7229 RepID=UPI00143F17E5|nr:rab-like protein 3 [Drosophila miranda]